MTQLTLFSQSTANSTEPKTRPSVLHIAIRLGIMRPSAFRRRVPLKQALSKLARQMRLRIERLVACEGHLHILIRDGRADREWLKSFCARLTATAVDKVNVYLLVAKTPRRPRVYFQIYAGQDQMGAVTEYVSGLVGGAHYSTAIRSSVSDPIPKARKKRRGKTTYDR